MFGVCLLTRSRQMWRLLGLTAGVVMQESVSRYNSWWAVMWMSGRLSHTRCFLSSIGLLSLSLIIQQYQLRSTESSHLSPQTETRDNLTEAHHRCLCLNYDCIVLRSKQQADSLHHLSRLFCSMEINYHKHYQQKIG